MSYLTLQIDRKPLGGARLVKRKLFLMENIGVLASSIALSVMPVIYCDILPY